MLLHLSLFSIILKHFFTFFKCWHSLEKFSGKYIHMALKSFLMYSLKEIPSRYLELQLYSHSFLIHSLFLSWLSLPLIFMMRNLNSSFYLLLCKYFIRKENHSKIISFPEAVSDMFFLNSLIKSYFSTNIYK